MAELSHLMMELERTEGVTDVELSDGTGVLQFRSHVGEYGCLTSEMVSTLGRYDCQVYTGDNGIYRLIPP